MPGPARGYEKCIPAGALMVVLDSEIYGISVTLDLRSIVIDPSAESNIL